jgi:hypothetical protein
MYGQSASDRARQTLVISCMGVWVACFGAVCAATAYARDDNGPGWLGERYPDPFNEGGMIVKAETAARTGESKVLRALVRCWTADASLDTRFFVAGSRLAPTGSLQWQFDRSPARAATWEVNPRGNQLIVPAEAEADFLQLMREKHTLELRLTDDQDNELHFTMPLDGSWQAIGDVVEACGA